MKNKRIIWILCLFLTIVGCDRQNNNISEENTFQGLEEGTEQVEVSEVMGTEKVEEPTTEATEELPQYKFHIPIQDLDEAYEAILGYGTKEFIGGHRLDESFLGWVRAQFGDEVVLAIADEAISEHPKVNKWYELTGNTIHVLWLNYCKQTGLEADQLRNVVWKECASDEEVVLDFIGDVNFAENWSSTQKLDSSAHGIYSCFSTELLEELNDADITMLNNEFTYSTRGTPLEGKKYTFRAKPERVKLLADLGVDIVSLANNHAYDYGEEALLDTMSILREAGIPYVGAGKNLDEAEKIVYFLANGRKIAIVSATQIERSTNYTKEATEDSPGVLKTLNPTKFLKVITEAKLNSDFIIVYVHWGTEHVDQYMSDQVELAQAYVAAGADVIVGGHTHCLQGIGYMDDTPIIYSLGNFWFNNKVLDTGITQVILKKDGSFDFRFLPCVQSNLYTSLTLDEGEKARIIEYMNSISPGVSIDEDGYVSKKE